MSRTPAITTLAVAALLAFPAATATWYSYGTYEPDTYLDVPTLMRDAPPGLAKNQIYFNAFYSSGELGGANGAWVNPNVGAAHTNLEPPGSTYFEAILGVWVDCNGDGYVGMVETAVREYDSRLLLDDSVCPRQTGPRTAWTAGAHNYNGWVSEYIPIGSNETRNADSRIYMDVNAMVWGDPGRPDDAAGPVGIQCQGRARGDSRTTGGILHQLDCQGNGIGVAATVAGQPVDTGIRVRIVDTINDVDGMLGTGLGFGNDPRTSASPLNQQTFGSDDSRHSAVYAQDCDADPVVQTDESPPGDDLDDTVLVREPTGNVLNPNVQDWTVPGTLNYTSESVWTPDGTFGPGSASDLEDQSSANCDFDDDAGQDFYILLESNVDVPPYNGKDAAWTNLRFNTATRGSAPTNFYPTSVNSGSGSAMVPTDLGVDTLGIACTASSCMQSNWLGAFVRYNPRLVDLKYDLGATPPTASGDLPRAPYYTFYAHVGKATTDRGFLTPGGSGEYGAAQCAGAETGEHNGWNCDSKAWYRLADGSYPSAPYPQARVGQTYEFRDVDCYDGNVGGTGVGTAVTFYGDHPCQR